MAVTQPLLGGVRLGAQAGPELPLNLSCLLLLAAEKRLGARAEAFRSLNCFQCCEGQANGSPDNSSELVQQSLIFLPSKVEICSTDKSNAFRENNSKAFLTNSSPSEHQATVVLRYSQLRNTVRKGKPEPQEKQASRRPDATRLFLSESWQTQEHTDL